MDAPGDGPRSSREPDRGARDRSPDGSPADPDDDPRGDPGGESPGESPEERRRRRRQLVLLLTPLSLAVVAGWVASALTPTLLARHPLLLVALDARNRNLVLAASLVGAAPLYLVATLRLLAVDPFTFLLGRWYGDAGLRWIERRFTSLQPTVDFLERIFRRAGWLAVALAPGAIVCTLAGAARMRVGTFLAANVIGTVARIYLLREVGVAFAGPVDAIRRFFDRYILWATLASVLLVVVWIWSERTRGRAEAESPLGLAEELEGELEDEEPGDGREDGAPGGSGDGSPDGPEGGAARGRRGERPRE